MILERVGASVFGLLTAATVVAPQPMVRHFLGYPFEVPSMIAALFAVAITRVIISMRAKSIPKPLDVAVLVLVLSSTAVVVIGSHASIIPAFLWGTGLAGLGEGILKIAEKFVAVGLEKVGIEVPKADTSDEAAIEAAMHTLDQVPD
ncbi:membrane hypothetical protein [Sphingomonas sp. AX6]|jgi:hypothetical protein|nr:membrane hypothetical protein [Sphingomonas sp. AX6]